jgi:hypothetical protein
VLKAFFAYQSPAFERWESAVEEWNSVIPELAAGVLNASRKNGTQSPLSVKYVPRFLHSQPLRAAPLQDRSRNRISH